MSWDIMLVNSRQKPDLDSDDPDLPLFPPKAELILAFRKTFPSLQVEENGWASIDAPDYSIELSFPDEEAPENQIMLFIRGGKDPMPHIAQLCRDNGWQAYDTTMGDYIDLDQPLKNGFSGWQSYRDQIVGEAPKPWWKFW